MRDVGGRGRRGEGMLVVWGEGDSRKQCKPPPKPYLCPPLTLPSETLTLPPTPSQVHERSLDSDFLLALVRERHMGGRGGQMRGGG